MLSLSVILATCFLAGTANAAAVEQITFPAPFQNATVAKDLIEVPYPNKEYYWVGDSVNTDVIRLKQTKVPTKYYAWLTNVNTTALSETMPLMAGALGMSNDTATHVDLPVQHTLNASDTYRIVLSETGYNGDHIYNPKQILGYSSLFSVTKQPNGGGGRTPPGSPGSGATHTAGLSLMTLALATTVALVL